MIPEKRPKNTYIITQKVSDHLSRIWKVTSYFKGQYYSCFEAKNALNPVHTRIFTRNVTVKVEQMFQIDKNCYEIVRIPFTGNVFIDDFLSVWGNYYRILAKNEDGYWGVSLQEKIKDEENIFLSKSCFFISFNDFKDKINTNPSYNDIISIY